MRGKLRIRKPLRISLPALLLTFVLPFAFVVVYQLTIEVNQRIDFTQAELYGTQYLRSLELLLQDVPQSQRIAQRYFFKEVPLLALKQQQAQIGKDMESVVQMDKALGDRLKTPKEFSLLQESWQHLNIELSQQIAQANFSTTSHTAIEDLHAKLLLRTRELISRIGDTSNLILDPDLDTYYLMDAILLKLPEAQELLANLQIKGDDVIRQRVLDPEDRGQMIMHIGVTQANSDATRKGMNVAFDNNPARSLQSVLQLPLRSALSDTQRFLDWMNQMLIQSETINSSAVEFDRRATSALNSSFELWQHTVKALDGLLEERIDRFRQKIYLVKIFTLLVLAAVGSVFAILSRNLKARRRADCRLNAQYAATRALAGSLTFSDAALTIIQAICGSMNWDLGEVWQLKTEANRLFRVESWGRSPQIVNWAATSELSLLAPGVGLAGQVWQRGEPVWLANLDAAALNAAALKTSALNTSALDTSALDTSNVLGQDVPVGILPQRLQSACGFPICNGDRVVGVAGVF